MSRGGFFLWSHWSVLNSSQPCLSWVVFCPETHDLNIQVDCAAAGFKLVHKWKEPTWRISVQIERRESTKRKSWSTILCVFFTTWLFSVLLDLLMSHCFTSSNKLANINTYFQHFGCQCLASGLLQNPFSPLSFYSVTLIWSLSTRNGHDLTSIIKRRLKDTRKQQSSDERKRKLQPRAFKSSRTNDAALSSIWLLDPDARIEATGWWRGWSQSCTENCLRGHNVHIDVAPSDTTQRESTSESAALDPISFVKMTHSNVFLAQISRRDHPLD